MMIFSGPSGGEGVFEHLAAKIPAYTASGNTVVFEKDPLAVLVLTPIMKRAHSLPAARQIVFSDSTSCCDRGKHSITFFMTPSPVGAVPLAVFITDSTTEESYTAAFKLLDQVFGQNAFGGQTNGPEIFMTDDSDAERNALGFVWQGATLLLCIFHVAQSIWRWLWDSKHCIDKDDRQPLMKEFLVLMRCNSWTDAIILYKTCCNNEIARKYPNYVNYLAKYWDRRQYWCLAYR